MKYSNIIGVSAPEIGWIPSPGFILRRAAIIDILNGLAPGSVLEMGCGPGGILFELGQKGFSGIGVEPSDTSRNISKKLLSDFTDVSVVKSLDDVEKQNFDYLFSFEVLEHIQDDVEALTAWVKYIKKDGLVFISVPAHMNKWNITDVMVGHFRRYEKNDVEKLMASAGLEILKLQTYGWPTSWILEKIRLWVKKYQLKKEDIDTNIIELGDIELSKKSGFERNTESKLFKYYGSKIIGQPIFFILTKLQKLFYKTNLGISYIVVARKSL